MSPCFWREAIIVGTAISTAGRGWIQPNFHVREESWNPESFNQSKSEVLDNLSLTCELEIELLWSRQIQGKFSLAAGADDTLYLMNLVTI